MTEIFTLPKREFTKREASEKTWKAYFQGDQKYNNERRERLKRREERLLGIEPKNKGLEKVRDMEMMKDFEQEFGTEELNKVLNN